jgi:hypothetical protein
MNSMGNGFLGVGFGGIVAVWAAAVPTIVPSIAWADGPGKAVQCWTDDHGVRACGDHVPPQYAKSERDIVDQRGVVVKVLPRQRTAAEQAEYDRQQEIKKQADTAVRQQAAYDGFLLQAYQSVAEIERTRDDRLASIDGRLLLIDKSRVSIDATLADLNTRAKTAGTPVPADLAKQLRSFQDARLENAGAMARLQDERNQTAEQFKKDIARYRELRGLPPQP